MESVQDKLGGEDVMLHVLLVDDEPYITQGLSVLIDWEKEGYEIIGTARNGIEAIEILNKTSVDLIIADINMPVMGGIELLEKIKKEQISDAYFVILSGLTDFSYAQSAIRYNCIDYILKPVKVPEILELLEKVRLEHAHSEKKEIEDKRFKKAYLSKNLIALLWGKFDSRNVDYVRTHMETAEKYRYISLEIEFSGEKKVWDEEEKKKAQRLLYQNTMDYLGDEYSNYCVYDVVQYENYYDVGVIFLDRMAKERNVTDRDFLNKMWETVSFAQEEQVHMYVGNYVEDITEIAESYRTATIVKSFQAFHMNDTITFYEEESIKHSNKVYVKEELDALVQVIEKNDKENIDECVENLYAEINQLHMDEKLINLNISYLLFQLMHVALEQDSKIDQEEVLHFISDNAFDYGVMRGSKEHFKRFAMEYAEYLTQLRKKNTKGVLGEVEREIAMHYAENVSLKTLSEKFYINSAYLGQIFKKQYGQSFKEYLNNYRVDKASELLVKTDEKIYNIAKMVGYHDLDYFINKFVTLKGCTPTKYRKREKELRQV